MTAPRTQPKAPKKRTTSVECRGSEMGAAIVGWALWRPLRACGVCHEERAAWAPRWPHETSGRYTVPWGDKGAGYGRKSGQVKPGEERARLRSLIGLKR